jgi:hypothetical protein
MTVAAKLAQRFAAEGIRRSEDSIYTIVSDDYNVHCMTAGMLDAWWSSLNPEKKADLFEADLDGLLYETIALANERSTQTPEFQAHVDQFFSDMDRRQVDPFELLAKELRHVSL